MELLSMNWMQIRDYLMAEDRAVVPIGSTEQHAFLSVGTDSMLAERVALEAAEPLGLVVFPVVPYGVAPYFSSYPGTVSLRVDTYVRLIRDLLDSLLITGFRRIALINGHGGNEMVEGLLREWMCDHEAQGAQVLLHTWCRGPRFVAAGNEFDLNQTHANWCENFRWNRVEEGRDIGPAAPISRSEFRLLTSASMRRMSEYGSLGGAYQRPDDDMDVVWQAAVSEVRDLLETGWLPSHAEQE